MHTVVSLYLLNYHSLEKSVLTQFAKKLDLAQKRKLERIHPRKQGEFICSRTLLKFCLNQHNHNEKHSWNIQERSQLPPLVTPTTKTKFSISHSDTMIGIAVCDSSHEIGFDLQQFKSFENQQLGLENAHYYCSEKELQKLSQIDKNNMTLFAASFTELWALKEAYFKSQHCGIHNKNLRKTNFTLCHEEDSNCVTNHWQDSNNTNYQLAIYSPEPIKVECHLLEEANNEFAIDNLKKEIVWRSFKTSKN